MSKPPNILWISFEDTNPFYGCYGDAVARTPNLDRLAAEGCRWPQAFSTAGVCAPARSAIITGMYAISTGAQHMRTTHLQEAMPELPTPYSAVLPPHVKCIPEYFRAAGYFCTNAEKTDYQFDSPLTAWDDLGLDAHWRDRPDAEQPFFSVFNIESTHESGMWEESSVDLTVDPAAIELPPYFPDTPKVREAMARMYSHISNNDRRLGELLRQLEEDGLADNTIVFHWSDHGPLPRGKRWPYDSGIRVPMIVRWPGQLEPGTMCEDLVSTLDLGPTILSLAGIERPAHLQGRCFLGPESDAPREYVYATRDRHDGNYDRVRAVRDRRFKYIRNYYPNQGRAIWLQYLNRHPIMQELWRLHLEGGLSAEQEALFFAEGRAVEELYDLEADPWEMNNLARQPELAGEKTRLRHAMDTWLDEVGDMSEVSESEMVRRWYPDGTQPQTTPPVGICTSADAPGIETVEGPESHRGPVELMLQSATQGASIAFRWVEGDSSRWRLYTGPIRLRKGLNQIHAIAERIGYRRSDEVSFTVSVGEAHSKAGQGEEIPRIQNGLV